MGMTVNSVYMLADAAFVGRWAGTMALAGLTITFPIVMCALGLSQLAGVGAASIVSRCLGAGDQRKAERAAGTSVTLSLILGVAFGALGSLFLHPVLRGFGAMDDVLPYAADYMRIVFPGSVLFIATLSAMNVVRAEGAIRRAVIATLISCLLNLGLDPLLIGPFGMGIKGAAYAWLIGQVAGAIYMTHFCLSKASILHVRLGDLKPDRECLAEALHIGSSSFTRVAAGSLGFIVLNHSIAAYGDEAHLAIMGIANRLVTFALLPIIGLSHGLQPILGFNFGAGDMRRVRAALRVATTAGSAMSASGCVLMIVFAPVLVSLFSSDPEVQAVGPSILRTLVTMFWLVGFQTVAVCLFQSLGKAVPALVLSLFRQVFALVPLMLLLPLWLGLRGVWLSYPAADAIAATLTVGLLFREIRQLGRPVITARPDAGPWTGSDAPA